MYRRGCLGLLLLIGTVAGTGGVTTSAYGKDCWQIYGTSDYINWNWDWGAWATRAEAEANARQACAVGSKITMIRNSCTGQEIPFSCPATGGGTVAGRKTPPANVSGYYFVYWAGGRWNLYVSPKANRQAEGACSQSVAQQWWQEVCNGVSRLYPGKVNNSNYWSYVRWYSYAWNGSKYQCVNGCVVPRSNPFLL
jgi:hypothetical protein